MEAQSVPVTNFRPLLDLNQETLLADFLDEEQCKHVSTFLNTPLIKCQSLPSIHDTGLTCLSLCDLPAKRPFTTPALQVKATSSLDTCAEHTSSSQHQNVDHQQQHPGVQHWPNGVWKQKLWFLVNNKQVNISQIPELFRGEDSIEKLRKQIEIYQQVTMYSDLLATATALRLNANATVHRQHFLEQTIFLKKMYLTFQEALDLNERSDRTDKRKKSRLQQERSPLRCCASRDESRELGSSCFYVTEDLREKLKRKQRPPSPSVRKKNFSSVGTSGSKVINPEQRFSHDRSHVARKRGQEPHDAMFRQRERKAKCRRERRHADSSRAYHSLRQRADGERRSTKRWRSPSTNVWSAISKRRRHNLKDDSGEEQANFDHLKGISPQNTYHVSDTATSTMHGRANCTHIASHNEHSVTNLKPKKDKSDVTQTETGNVKVLNEREPSSHQQTPHDEPKSRTCAGKLRQSTQLTMAVQSPVYSCFVTENMQLSVCYPRKKTSAQVMKSRCAQKHVIRKSQTLLQASYGQDICAFESYDPVHSFLYEDAPLTVWDHTYSQRDMTIAAAEGPEAACTESQRDYPLPVLIDLPRKSSSSVYLKLPADVLSLCSSQDPRAARASLLTTRTFVNEGEIVQKSHHGWRELLTSKDSASIRYPTRLPSLSDPHITSRLSKQQTMDILDEFCNIVRPLSPLSDEDDRVCSKLGHVSAAGQESSLLYPASLVLLASFSKRQTMEIVDELCTIVRPLSPLADKVSCSESLGESERAARVMVRGVKRQCLCCSGLHYQLYGVTLKQKPSPQPSSASLDAAFLPIKTNGQHLLQPRSLEALCLSILNKHWHLRGCQLYCLQPRAALHVTEAILVPSLLMKTNPISDTLSLPSACNRNNCHPVNQANCRIDSLECFLCDTMSTPIVLSPADGVYHVSDRPHQSPVTWSNHDVPHFSGDLLSQVMECAGLTEDALDKFLQSDMSVESFIMNTETTPDSYTDQFWDSIFTPAVTSSQEVLVACGQSSALNIGQTAEAPTCSIQFMSMPHSDICHQLQSCDFSLVSTSQPRSTAAVQSPNPEMMLLDSTVLDGKSVVPISSPSQREAIPAADSSILVVQDQSPSICPSTSIGIRRRQLAKACLDRDIPPYTRACIRRRHSSTGTWKPNVSILDEPGEKLTLAAIPFKARSLVSIEKTGTNTETAQRSQVKPTCADSKKPRQSEIALTIQNADSQSKTLNKYYQSRQATVDKFTRQLSTVSPGLLQYLRGPRDWRTYEKANHISTKLFCPLRLYKSRRRKQQLTEMNHNNNADPNLGKGSTIKNGDEKQSLVNGKAQAGRSRQQPPRGINKSAFPNMGQRSNVLRGDWAHRRTSFSTFLSAERNADMNKVTVDTSTSLPAISCPSDRRVSKGQELSTLAVPDKEKACVLRFVQRLETPYGDQLTKGNADMRTRLNKLCDKYLTMHGTHRLVENKLHQRPLNTMKSTGHEALVSSSKLTKRGKLPVAHNSNKSCSVQSCTAKDSGVCCNTTPDRKKPKTATAKPKQSPNIKPLHPEVAKIVDRLSARPLSPNTRLLQKIQGWEHEFGKPLTIARTLKPLKGNGGKESRLADGKKAPRNRKAMSVSAPMKSTNLKNMEAGDMLPNTTPLVTETNTNANMSSKVDMKRCLEKLGRMNLASCVHENAEEKIDAPDLAISTQPSTPNSVEKLYLQLQSEYYKSLRFEDVKSAAKPESSSSEDEMRACTHSSLGFGSLSPLNPIIPEDSPFKFLNLVDHPPVDLLSENPVCSEHPVKSGKWQSRANDHNSSSGGQEEVLIVQDDLPQYDLGPEVDEVKYIANIAECDFSGHKQEWTVHGVAQPTGYDPTFLQNRGDREKAKERAQQVRQKRQEQGPREATDPHDVESCTSIVQDGSAGEALVSIRKGPTMDLWGADVEKDWTGKWLEEEQVTKVKVGGDSSQQVCTETDLESLESLKKSVDLDLGGQFRYVPYNGMHFVRFQEKLDSNKFTTDSVKNLQPLAFKRLSPIPEMVDEEEKKGKDRDDEDTQLQ